MSERPHSPWKLAVLRDHFAVLALACSTLFYLPLGLRALWDSPEGKIAEIAREMIELKDWIVPHLNYEVYLQTPPLMDWVTAMSLRAMGFHPFAARFACATFGLLTVWATYRLGKNWKNERVGLLAGGLLATSAGFFASTQFLLADVAVTFWTTLTLWAGAGLFWERSIDKARRLAYLFALGMAGGVLTRGPAAFFLPSAAWAVVFLSQSRRRSARIPWTGPLVLAFILIVPWCLAISLRVPTYPIHFFMPDEGRSRPFYFYFLVLMLGFLPWSVFLPRVARTWLGQRHAALQRDPGGAFFVSWVFLVFIYFTLWPAKELGSILPIFPALAVLLAHELDAALEEDRGIPNWMTGGLFSLIALFAAALVCLKAPMLLPSLTDPEWKALIQQSDVIALLMASGVFVCVGLWGMRQTLAALGGLMLVQVALLTSSASLLSELDLYRSGQTLAQRFLLRAGHEDTLVTYGLSRAERLQSLPFYLKRRIPEASLETLTAAAPGTWGVTDALHWQELRQSAPANMFQPVPVPPSGNWVLFRKEQ